MGITCKFAEDRFYPSDIDYGTIPDGAVDVPEEEFFKAMKRPRGYDFSVDDNGTVTLIAPVITEEEQQLEAEAQRALLRQQADGEIAWRQDAVEAGIATAEEAAALAEWKKYRVLLMRVDTSKAPDIEWPKIP